MQTVFMKCSIWFNISLWIFSLSRCIWLGKIRDDNNIYTSWVNSTEPYIEPDFIHQIHMHAINRICVIINMLYLDLLDDQ